MQCFVASLILVGCIIGLLLARFDRWTRTLSEIGEDDGWHDQDTAPR